jgi:hypothetical protein
MMFTLTFPRFAWPLGWIKSNGQGKTIAPEPDSKHRTALMKSHRDQQ